MSKNALIRRIICPFIRNEKNLLLWIKLPITSELSSYVGILQKLKQRDRNNL